MSDAFSEGGAFQFAFSLSPTINYPTTQQLGGQLGDISVREAHKHGDAASKRHDFREDPMVTLADPSPMTRYGCLCETLQPEPRHQGLQRAVCTAPPAVIDAILCVVAVLIRAINQLSLAVVPWKKQSYRKT